jgi:hypothetical protein
VILERESKQKLLEAGKHPPGWVEECIAVAFTLKCKDSWTMGADILIGRRRGGRREVDGERRLRMKTRASENPRGIYGNRTVERRRGHILVHVQTALSSGSVESYPNGAIKYLALWILPRLNLIPFQLSYPCSVLLIMFYNGLSIVYIQR